MGTGAVAPRERRRADRIARCTVMIESGADLNELARAEKVGRPAIENWLSKWAPSLLAKARRNALPREATVTPGRLERAKRWKEWIRQGVSCREIARREDITPQAVSAWISRWAQLFEEVPEADTDTIDPTPVILESPYANDVGPNTDYLRLCLKDSISLGEAPFASHGLYTQPGVLDDSDPQERKRGIAAGSAWRRLADTTVVYTDRGISPGMRHGIEESHRLGHKVVYRSIDTV